MGKISFVGFMSIVIFLSASVFAYSKHDIQEALKNAGYYNGEVDGKPSKELVEATKKFQEDNKLEQDGKVGPETWPVLSKYLKKELETIAETDVSGKENFKKEENAAYTPDNFDEAPAVSQTEKTEKNLIKCEKCEERTLPPKTVGLVENPVKDDKNGLRIAGFIIMLILLGSMAIIILQGKKKEKTKEELKEIKEAIMKTLEEFKTVPEKIVGRVGEIVPELNKKLDTAVKATFASLSKNFEDKIETLGNQIKIRQQKAMSSSDNGLEKAGFRIWLFGSNDSHHDDQFIAKPLPEKKGYLIVIGDGVTGDGCYEGRIASVISCETIASYVQEKFNDLPPENLIEKSVFAAGEKLKGIQKKFLETNGDYQAVETMVRNLLSGFLYQDEKKEKVVPLISANISEKIKKKKSLDCATTITVILLIENKAYFVWLGDGERIYSRNFYGQPVIFQEPDGGLVSYISGEKGVAGNLAKMTIPLETNDMLFFGSDGSHLGFCNNGTPYQPFFTVLRENILNTEKNPAEIWYEKLKSKGAVNDDFTLCIVWRNK